ncbi:hypothetical protein [Oerskovia turbata]
MDARRIWITTGTLGVLGVGLGATVAAAEVRSDAEAPAVVETTDGATNAPGAGVTPSPSDLDPSSSTTTVSTNTAGSPTSAQSADTAQTAPSAPTP